MIRNSFICKLVNVQASMKENNVKKSKNSKIKKWKKKVYEREGKVLRVFSSGRWVPRNQG